MLKAEINSVKKKKGNKEVIRKLKYDIENNKGNLNILRREEIDIIDAKMKERFLKYFLCRRFGSPTFSTNRGVKKDHQIISFPQL